MKMSNVLYGIGLSVLGTIGALSVPVTARAEAGSYTNSCDLPQAGGGWVQCTRQFCSYATNQCVTVETYWRWVPEAPVAQ